MRRPPARRPRPALIAAAVLAATASACADDGPPAAARRPTAVTVQTQRCEQPNLVHGMGVVAGDDLVVTAGHTVEGNLRQLHVDGRPARVVLIDRRTDLALLSTDVPPDAVAAEPSDEIPGLATMLGPSAAVTVAIDRHVTLDVEHDSDRRTYRRGAVIFTPGVIDGDSGSPVIDESGRLVGVVVAGQRGEGVATDAFEVAGLLLSPPVRDPLGWPNPPGTC